MRKIALIVILIVIGYVIYSTTNDLYLSKVEDTEITKSKATVVNKQKNNNRYYNATSSNSDPIEVQNTKKHTFSAEKVIEKFSLKGSLYNIEEADALADLTIDQKRKLASFIFKSISSNIIYEYDKNAVKDRLIKIDLVRELIDDGEINLKLEKEITQFLSLEHANKIIKVDKSELLGLLCKIDINNCVDQYKKFSKLDTENTNKIFVTRELLNIGVSLNEINILLN